MSRYKKDLCQLPSSILLVEALLIQLRLELREAESLLDEAVSLYKADYFVRAVAAKASIKAEQLHLAQRMVALNMSWYARSLTGLDQFENWIRDPMEAGKFPDELEARYG